MNSSRGDLCYAQCLVVSIPLPMCSLDPHALVDFRIDREGFYTTTFSWCIEIQSVSLAGLSKTKDSWRDFRLKDSTTHHFRNIKLPGYLIQYYDGKASRQQSCFEPFPPFSSSLTIYCSIHPPSHIFIYCILLFDASTSSAADPSS